MARFQYRAIGPDGEVRNGELEATDEHQALEQLNRDELLPLDVKPAPKLHGVKRRSRLFARTPRIRRDDIVALTSDLSTLLGAGLPLESSLGVVEETAENAAVAELAAEIRERIRGGAALSEALEDRQSLFGRLYINMVRAGEVSGAVDKVLERLSDYLERSQQLRRSVVSALIYPAILLGVAVLSVVVLLTFVVPQFAQMFDDMGQALPAPTQFVMSAGNLFRDHGLLLLAALVGLVYGLRRIFRNPDRRTWLDGSLLHWPVAGSLIQRVETARFSRTLGTLMDNGVHLLQALELSAGTLGNRVMAAAVAKASESVREGGSLALSLEADGHFPRLSIQLIRVGEESGKLEKMLLKIAQVYDGEVEAAVKRTLALVEPVIILGLGAVIAGIILSILVAIMGVNDLAF